MTPTIGKIRRLQQCATPNGRFVILAIDHRDNLQEMLQKAHGSPMGYAEMVTFKQTVTAALQETFSAVLLDPLYGAAQGIVTGAVPGGTGLLLCIESSGYSGEPTLRETAVLPQWRVAKIARMGGTGVKMLLYYHPDAPNVAAQEAVVQQVAADCQKHEVPFFLEPIVYSLDPQATSLPTAEKRQLVLAAARRLTPLGVDILKAEFPINIADEPDESVWAAACVELTAASSVPWVLLSAGVAYDAFMRQATIACQAGCSGVMVGRAVWQEAIRLQGAKRERFLRETTVARMRQLGKICEEYGRSWTAVDPDLANIVNQDWYQSY